MELKELLRLLEERLTQHDNNRKDVQSKCQEICTKELSGVNALEERIAEESQDAFSAFEGEMFAVIEKISNNQENNLDDIVKEAQDLIILVQKYEIEKIEGVNKFADSYKLKITIDKIAEESISSDTDFITSQLHENMTQSYDSMVAAQNKMNQIIKEHRNAVEEFKKKINERLEKIFNQEDARIQEIVNLLKKEIDDGHTIENADKEVISRAKAELIIKKRYSLEKTNNGLIIDSYDFVESKDVSLKCLDFENRKPIEFKSLCDDNADVIISFAFFDEAEIELLKKLNITLDVTMCLCEKNPEGAIEAMYSKEYPLSTTAKDIIFNDTVMSSMEYTLKARLEHIEEVSQWSDVSELVTKDFVEWFRWKKQFGDKPKYIVDENNARIATKIASSGDSTIVGNVPLPTNKIISWDVKIINSRNNDGYDMYIGVAPFDIDLDGYCNYNKCGWYFEPSRSILLSGPPHNYKFPGKEYSGPKSFFFKSKSIRTGDVVSVTFDASSGVLSYAVNGKNYGVAFEGIPLDKFLVPCVLLKNEGDSVEVKVTEVKNVTANSSIPAPTNIVTKSDTWDSITLAWNAVKGAASYQVECDGRSSVICPTETNTFTKYGFSAESEHRFRVRAVVNNSVGAWSDVVKGKTEKKLFQFSRWKDCSGKVLLGSRYELGKQNRRVTTHLYNENFSVNIGNTPLPSNAVTSWNIKLPNVVGSGWKIYIGVAPADINQSTWSYTNHAGWFFTCNRSSLYSGAPHHYRDESYGPEKSVYPGDVIGCIMDTINGTLSFVVDGINYGVAYGGIPLDKPLVPCVVLGNSGQSAEIDISEVKEKDVDPTVPLPPELIAESTAQGSITLDWHDVDGASFYQVQTDNGASYKVLHRLPYTITNLVPNSEHSFRVRVIKNKSLGAWSDVVKATALGNKIFAETRWKELHEDDDAFPENRRYRLLIPTIASNTGDDWCTVIGDMSIPLDTVTSWNIKTRSKYDNSNSIYVGVAPADIDQSAAENYNRCGWYFNCYDSTLSSGAPHNCAGKEYGPRKENGTYVKGSDTVGVVMDMTKGVLSFTLNGVDLGVAFEGIPLDRPLVPCVILKNEGDNVTIEFKRRRYEHHYESYPNLPRTGRILFGCR